jgi:hypothetical protein
MPTSRSPDAHVDPPIAKGDGRGIGQTIGPDVSVETERREIERSVYERRTVRDRAAEDRGPAAPDQKASAEEGAPAPTPPPSATEPKKGH